MLRAQTPARETEDDAETECLLRQALGPRPPRARRLTNRAVSTLQSFAARRELLRDALSASEVAQMLGVSKETVYARHERGELLGLVDGGQLRFPAWQFDPTSDDGMLPGFQRLMRELRPRSAYAKLVWFTSPTEALGAAPLDTLRQDAVEAVLPAAQRFARGE